VAQKSLWGFTLAELLIALAILGVIATFTIPKILSVQQNGTYNTKAKEAAAMVAVAHKQARLAGELSASTGIDDLTQYMNYVRTDTSTVVDHHQLAGTYTCGSEAAAQCLRLHSGAIMRYGNSIFTIGGTNTTNAIWFSVDPDGTSDGTTNGPGKAVEFWIYYSGRLATYGTMSSNTCQSISGTPTCHNPNPALDPPWFSW
jgi:prepilin-type N-terminal cleavage/methylation domain-containing protein